MSEMAFVIQKFRNLPTVLLQFGSKWAFRGSIPAELADKQWDTFEEGAQEIEALGYKPRVDRPNHFDKP